MHTYNQSLDYLHTFNTFSSFIFYCHPLCRLFSLLIFFLSLITAAHQHPCRPMPRIDVVAVTFFCVLLFPFCCCSFKMRKFFFFSSSFHYYCQFAVDAVAMIMTECHRFSEHKTSPVGIGFGILISILICFRLLSLAFIWIVSCFQILEVYMRFYGQNCAHFSPFFRLTRVVEHFISFFCILSYFLVVFLFTFAFI